MTKINCKICGKVIIKNSPNHIFCKACYLKDKKERENAQQIEYMEKKLQKIRKQIKELKAKEAEIMLQIVKEKAKIKDTIKIPGITKTTWKKLEGQVNRSTLYRRAKKQISR